MALIFNSNTISTSTGVVKYNGNNVTKVVYNGTTVWEKSVARIISSSPDIINATYSTKLLATWNGGDGNIRISIKYIGAPKILWSMTDIHINYDMGQGTWDENGWNTCYARIGLYNASGGLIGYIHNVTSPSPHPYTSPNMVNQIYTLPNVTAETNVTIGLTAHCVWPTQTYANISIKYYQG